jgi:hypothetical protein
LPIWRGEDHVKVNFFKGASLDDPHGLFNAGLEAKASRAIDVHEGDRVNTTALTDLARTAVALNVGVPKRKAPAKLAPEITLGEEAHDPCYSRIIRREEEAYCQLCTHNTRRTVPDLRHSYQSAEARPGNSGHERAWLPRQYRALDRHD